LKAYYFAEGGQQRGPFPAEELARQGVRPETLIWAEGMPNWVPAQSVPEVAAAFAPAAASAQAFQQPYPQHQPPHGYAPPAGYPQQPTGYPQQPGYATPVAYGSPYAPAGPAELSAANGKKIAAGLCAILIGWLGIHKFVMGFTTAGVIYILVSVVGGIVTCGASTSIMAVLALIEGILYLTKSDAEFHQTYMVQQKQWF